MQAIRKIIICDDEADARFLIREYLGDYPQMTVIAECANGSEAVEKIDELEPDLVFLDIQMPGLSGFQVLRQLVHIPQIIFSTAFDKYALKAFDNNAIDYLLKPYTRQRFGQALSKLMLGTARNQEAIRNLSDNVQAEYNAYPDKVLVESGSRMIALQLTDISWIEADGDYTRIHVRDRSYLSSYGIGVLEQKFNPRLFARIHRSAMVNLNEVKEVYRDNNGYYVVLQNGMTHKVGRYYTDVIKKLTL